MQTLNELGKAVAQKRRELRMQQADLASRSGITQESLSRFERGRSAELGARKLLRILAVLGMEIEFVKTGTAGTLDDLRRERGGE
jgi:transcriptional regulator with XRE-family HTH domain